MEKFFLKNLHQVHMGQIVSAIGLVLYFAAAALALPDTLLALEAGIFFFVAFWTLLSILAYPEEKRTEEITYSIIWGQGAVTILLGACFYLTTRSLIGR